MHSRCPTPEQPAAWAELGRVQLARGEEEQAIDALDRALDLEPVARSFAQRGLAKLNLNRLPEAREDLERARELFGLAEGDTAIFTELAPSRRLFDQPEWIANIDLTFDHPDWGTRFTLAYFAICDRLDAAGSATRDATGLLTSFTLDRYVDAFDELRLTVSQEIKLPNEFGSLTLRFSAKNLTDSERCRVYDPDQTFGRFEERCFNVGRDYDLSLTYTRRF